MDGITVLSNYTSAQQQLQVIFKFSLTAWTLFTGHVAPCESAITNFKKTTKILKVHNFILCCSTEL